MLLVLVGVEESCLRVIAAPKEALPSRISVFIVVLELSRCLLTVELVVAAALPNKFAPIVVLEPPPSVSTERFVSDADLSRFL